MKSVKGLEDIANAVELDMGATDPKTEGASAIALPAYNFDTARASSLAEVDDVPDRRVMETSPRTDAQIVESISTGDPSGLEHMYFGATELGHPVIGFRDSNGNTQVMKVTPSQWMAAKEARRLNRERVLEEQDRQENLNKEKTELRPSFENGLDTVDNEAYRALLVQLFETNPQDAMIRLVNDQRQSQADADKNEQVRMGQLRDQAWATSRSLQEQNTNERAMAVQRVEQSLQQALRSTGDSSAAVAQIRSQQREIALRDRAMSYAPVQSNAMASPAEGMSPRQFQDALASWLALPDVERMIPHPSNPNYESAMGDLMASLNGVVRDIGWQQGLTPEDMPAIAQAANAYLGVHGEVIEIQSLTKENERLQKQIDELKAQQVDVTALQEEATAQRAGISQMQSDVTLKRAKDTNRDGVVSAEEEASFEQDKSTLESGRAAVKGAEKAKARKADAESKTKLNEELLRISKEIDTLTEQIIEVGDDPDYTERVGNWKNAIAALKEEAKMLTDAGTSEEEKLMEAVIDAFGSWKAFEKAVMDSNDPRHDEAVKLAEE